MPNAYFPRPRRQAELCGGELSKIRLKFHARKLPNDVRDYESTPEQRTRYIIDDVYVPIEQLWCV